MLTRPCKLQDPVKVQAIVDAYFADREEQQEVRELKNGDKRIYRKPPSIWSLSKKLGITDDCFREYISEDAENNEAYNKEIIAILRDAKQRIIDELYEGVACGYWTEKIILAQLQKFGVIGDTDDHQVKVVIQGSNSWSE